MTDAASLNGALPPRLLDQVRGQIRLKRYILRTEKAYSNWIKRHIRLHGKSHQCEWVQRRLRCF